MQSAQESVGPEARDIGMLELFWMSCKNHPFIGNMRATRREFWNFIAILLSIALLLLAQGEVASGVFGAAFGMVLVGLIAIHPFLLTGITLARLYDIGGRGWHFVLLLLGTALFSLAFTIMVGNGVVFFFMWILLNILFCLIIGCIPSSLKPNAYQNALPLPPMRKRSSYPPTVYPRGSHLHERLAYGICHALRRRGRSDREEFWPYFFIMALLTTIAVEGFYRVSDALGYDFYLAGQVYFIILYLLLAGVCVRRFRDAGVPGWLAELIWSAFLLLFLYPAVLNYLPFVAVLILRLLPLASFLVCLLPSRPRSTS